MGEGGGKQHKDLEGRVSVQTYSYSGRVEHMEYERKEGNESDAGERNTSQEGKMSGEGRKLSWKMATKGVRDAERAPTDA